MQVFLETDRLVLRRFSLADVENLVNLDALIRKGFTELGVQRVVAETMAVNQASRRVMEKAGLKLVRTFQEPWPYPIDGDQFGGVEYALDKAGWQQQDTSAGNGPPN